MERIFVTYSYVMDSPTGRRTYHMAINYTNSSGLTLVLDAGPQDQVLHPRSDFIDQEFFSFSQTDSPWGRLVFRAPRETVASHTLPQETIITGDNLSHYWDRMVEGSQRANELGFEYRPWSQSSNTGAVSIFDFAGLLRPVGMSDDGRFFYTPGSGGHLRNPISGGTNPFTGPFTPQGLSDGPLHLNQDQTIEQHHEIRGGPLSGHGVDVVYADASQPDLVTISDPSGAPAQVQDWAPDGSQVTTVFDPTNAFIWDQRTFAFGANDNPIGIATDYTSAFDGWLLDHEFTAAELAQFDAAAAIDLSAAFERSVYRGIEAEGSAPSPLSFETSFSSAYDFRASTFTVEPNGFVHVRDAGAGFDVTGWIGGGSNGVDAVGLSFRFPTNIFDVVFSILGSLFSPIILDLDGDGVEVTPRSDSTDYFDVDGDNFLEQTAWAGPGDALLMVEDGGNAVSLNEVSFARRTADPNDTDLEALAAEFDTNRDGRLSSGDARWGDFWFCGNPRDKETRSPVGA
jgi:hypothetical protein